MILPINLATFNRTILELKYVLSCFALLANACFQPYHTGIEITDVLERMKNHRAFNRNILELKSVSDFQKGNAGFCFQPYHTGIEIVFTLIFVVCIIDFQPYHTGIEML